MNQPIKRLQPTAKTETTQEPPKATTTLVRAVHGRMVDPTDCAEYSQEARVVTKVTGWMKCQAEAKKLEITVI